MKIKICGITNISDAMLCEKYGADALGFIFYDKSRRYITPEEAHHITSSLSPFTIKVGVFVDEKIEKIKNIYNQLSLNVIQLHGNEDFEYIKYLNLPVIKSFRIDSGFNFDILNDYPGVTFLFDAYSDTIQGGTGKTFNWDLIPENIKNKIILAGGVSADNIEEIINKINPLAVDLSSSIESVPGKKDQVKTMNFFNKLKQIRRTQWL